MVERFVRIEEVAVSTTVGSTKARCIHSTAAGFFFLFPHLFKRGLQVQCSIYRRYDIEASFTNPFIEPNRNVRHAINEPSKGTEATSSSHQTANRLQSSGFLHNTRIARSRFIALSHVPVERGSRDARVSVD